MKRLTSGVVVVLSDVEGKQFGVDREMPSGCRVSVQLWRCCGAYSLWLCLARLSLRAKGIYRRTAQLSRLRRRQEQNAQVMSPLFIVELNVLTFMT